MLSVPRTPCRVATHPAGELLASASGTIPRIALSADPTDANPNGSSTTSAAHPEWPDHQHDDRVLSRGIAALPLTHCIGSVPARAGTEQGSPSSRPEPPARRPPSARKVRGSSHHGRTRRREGVREGGSRRANPGARVRLGSAS